MPTGFASARLLASLAALALLPALGGCVAAAALAVPAMTAIGAATRDKSPPKPDQAAEPPAATVAEEERLADSGSVELLPLTELPPPSGGSAPAASDTWRDFLAFALSRKPDAQGQFTSAMLSQDSKLDLLPRFERCERDERAVVIDLDPGTAAFEPGAQLHAQPALADKLDVLRRAGILVMWISRQDPNRVSDIADALLRSGLDPTGRDPILLTLGDGDRKQTLREQAAQTACVVAIAGDERQDFDELFGYLRNPTMATNFDSLLGAGWFLVPSPLVARD
ncbi:MAG: hypothetical protein ACO1OD_11555 [Croceibacterium sp.]